MSEFKYVERVGPYVDCKEARDAMTALAIRHGLTFTHNPGGGQFFGNGYDIQIGCCDDLADLAKMREMLARPQEDETR